MFLTEMRKITYTYVNPSSTISKWGLMGSKLCRHVFVIDDFSHLVAHKISLIFTARTKIVADLVGGGGWRGRGGVT